MLGVQFPFNRPISRFGLCSEISLAISLRCFQGLIISGVGICWWLTAIPSWSSVVNQWDCCHLDLLQLVQGSAVHVALAMRGTQLQSRPDTFCSQLVFDAFSSKTASTTTIVKGVGWDCSVATLLFQLDRDYCMKDHGFFNARGVAWALWNINTSAVYLCDFVSGSVTFLV